MRITERWPVAGTPSEVLDFVGDFANLPAWDWSAARVERLAGDGLAAGNRYRVHLGVGPLTTTLDYAVTSYEPGRSAVLLSDTGAVRSEDTISVEQVGGETFLTYDAALSTGWLGDLFEPASRPVFALHGYVVMRRLQAVLAARLAGPVAAMRPATP